MLLKGVTLTKGHLASNGGLRGHSVGDVFPVIISYAGKLDNLKRYVTAPDGASHLVNNDAEARELALAWLETRKHTDGQAVGVWELCKVRAHQYHDETQCEVVTSGPFDFYSVYARNEDGEASPVWDSKGTTAYDLMMGYVVLEFLQKRGVKL